MKSQNITSKNFGRKLSGVVSSAKSMRANLQQIILFAMEQYLAHSDTGYLDRCMSACVGVSALPTQKMKLFIQEHANVSYREVEIKSGKNKGDKIHVFKKSGKVATYKEPTTNWWEFSKAGDVVADLDTDARIINFIKTLDKNLEKGTVKNKDHAIATRKALTALTTKLSIAVA